MAKEAAGPVERPGVREHHVVLVLDSGGSSCKLGISGEYESIVYVMRMYPRAASGAVSGVAEDVNGLSDFESATAARCSVLGARQAHPSVARPPPPPLCSMFPNAVGKLSGKKLLGQEIWDAQDVSSLQLKRPVDRGYVVNWDLQKEIWGHGFKALLMDRDDVRGRISGIVVSEPVRDGFTVCIVRIVRIVCTVPSCFSPASFVRST